MAAGLPTIASRTEAFESVLRDDHTGVLFRPGDAKSLASALGKLHADPLRRRHVGHEARAYAAAHFTWRKSLDRILELAAAPAH
jgi:glycosyltransferase involved in cell wall biosynthesis